MSKFVKGQTVKIKDDLIVGKWYGDCRFVENMMKSRGDYATIKEVDEDGDYRLDNTIYWWSDEMLDYVYCKDCIDYATPLAERPCCDCSHNSRFTPLNTFEVGDLVRIKDNMVIGKKYGNLTYLSDMDDYKGRVYRVIKVSKEGNYTLDSHNPFFWSGDMLEQEVDCEDRLEVKPPSLENLVHIITDTCKQIIENDTNDQLEKYQLDFITTLVVACCDYQLDTLLRKEDEDNGNC